MNYLICMLVIGVIMGGFLWILNILERGHWPSENVVSLKDAVRELVLGPRTS